jgi:AraC-like DNA-binding protein
MEDYNKIIESLHTRFVKSSYLDVIQPVWISNYFDFQNTLVLLKQGQAQFGDPKESISPGEVLFIPGNKNIPLILGGGDPVKVTNDDFFNRKEMFIRSKYGSNGVSTDSAVSLITITFETKAFESVNFFSSLDIPPFVLRNSNVFSNLILKMNQEVISNQPGKARLLNLYVDELVVELFRYIINRGMFLEQLATNSNYFKDPRLIDIFNYIKENLAGDLSNKVLANVANVSEDYVGQYFKMLTGINPQDYIEYQRMEKAVHLLRTSKKSIRVIGTDVGYKDTAYFCRRFKMMFGIPAGRMRRRESLMDI